MTSKILLFALLFLTAFLSLAAQDSTEQLFTRRIIWKGGEPSLRYSVEIDRLSGGNYSSHIRDFTTNQYFDISLPAGEYRFRIIPYDILDRPGEESEWVSLKIDPVNGEAAQQAALLPETTAPESVQAPEPAEQSDVVTEPEPLQQPEIVLEPEPSQQPEVVTEPEPQLQPEAVTQPEVVSQPEPEVEPKEKTKYTGNPYFNSIGVSLGTSFADPLLIASIHGTYSPFSKLPNLFFQLGCDFGFISEYSDVEEYYSIYPFFNAGYFLPFRKNIDFFAGTGIGYMAGEYSFSYGKSEISNFGINFFTGVILFNMINITYGIRTDFDSLGHRLTAGYIYRFPSNDADKAEEKIEPSVPVQQEKPAPSEKYTGNPYFDTLGVSLGTSFTDPLVILTLHGTYSPLRNLFIELGCDFGFVSEYSDVEKYYSFYPFLNAGYFLPFRKNIDFFAGAGIGYMAGEYSFSYGTAGVGVFAANIFAGVNLFDMINISYTLRTDFGSVNHKLSAGYTYRFARRNKNAKE